MRNFMKLFETVESPAEIYIRQANEMLSSEFSGKIVCDLGEPWGNDTGDLVEIEHIGAIEMKQGWGTKAMSRLCQLADQLGVTLTLGVANETDDYYDTDDDEFPSEDVLIDFYSRFGFEEKNSFSDRVEMVRTPN